MSDKLLFKKTSNKVFVIFTNTEDVWEEIEEFGKGSDCWKNLEETYSLMPVSEKWVKLRNLEYNEDT